MVPPTRRRHDHLVAEPLDESGGFNSLGVAMAQLPLLISPCGSGAGQIQWEGGDRAARAAAGRVGVSQKAPSKPTAESRVTASPALQAMPAFRGCRVGLGDQVRCAELPLESPLWAAATSPALTLFSGACETIGLKLAASS